MAKVYPMVSLELDDEDQLDMVCPMPISDRPRYPYGTKICLTDKEMTPDKLNLDPKDAFVGGMVHLHAMARITSVSCDDTEGGQRCRVELQIEDMCLEAEDEENAEADAEAVPLRRRAALYGR